MRAFPATLALLALLTAAGCSSASYTERMAYLRKVANRGVETHNLLAAQGAKIDAKRCDAAYDALDEDLPNDEGTGESIAWRAQVRQFFVDSCVTGLPKPVPGQPTPNSPSPTTPPASPSKTPSKTP